MQKRIVQLIFSRFQRPCLFEGLRGGFEKTWGPFGIELGEFILSGHSDLNRYAHCDPLAGNAAYAQGLFDFCAHFASLHDAHAEDRLHAEAFIFGGRWYLGDLTYALRIETTPIVNVRGFNFSAPRRASMPRKSIGTRLWPTTKPRASQSTSQRQTRPPRNYRLAPFEPKPHDSSME